MTIDWLNVALVVAGVPLGYFIHRMIYNSGQLAGYRKGYTTGHSQGTAEATENFIQMMDHRQLLADIALHSKKDL